MTFVFFKRVQLRLLKKTKEKKMAPDFGFFGLSSSILVEHIHVLGTSGDTSTTYPAKR